MADCPPYDPQSTPETQREHDLRAEYEAASEAVYEAEERREAARVALVAYRRSPEYLALVSGAKG